MLVRMALIALFAGAASAASAAQFRPLEQKNFCLDASHEMRPGLNRISLAECDDSEGQEFYRGKEYVIYNGRLCLQAIAITGKEEIDVAAIPCHGRDGQRWLLTRDGRLTSGDNLCLTVTGQGTESKISMLACKQPPESLTDQKWAIYGKFE